MITRFVKEWYDENGEGSFGGETVLGPPNSLLKVTKQWYYPVTDKFEDVYYITYLYDSEDDAFTALNIRKTYISNIFNDGYMGEYIEYTYTLNEDGYITDFEQSGKVPDWKSLEQDW